MFGSNILLTVFAVPVLTEVGEGYVGVTGVK